MRLFVAIDLPDELKNELFNLQNKVHDAKITWVAKKHLHLTLKFMGDVPTDKIKEVKSRVSSIVFPSFSIKLGELGFFPNKENPNVFWVSILPKDKVIALQQKVDEVLLEILPTEQKFVSHITLGRVKMVRRKKDFEKSVTDITLSDTPYVLHSFSLFSSVVTGRGPIYEVLEIVQMS
jgi:RNA 2',3'-cyclic 3'-phosphodiesterase